VRTKLIALGLALCGAATAKAQDIPPQEQGVFQFTSRLISGQVEVRDADTGVAVIVPKEQFLALFPPEIHCDLQLRSQPTGCDIVVAATNTGAAPAEMGHFCTGIINLGQHIEFFDFRATCEPVTQDFATAVPQGWCYPNDLYSPVFVVRNSTYAVGVSLQYPVMDYKHDVMMMMGAGRGSLMEGEGGPGWVCDFGLGRQYNNVVRRWGILQPGETRTYVVSVRVTRNPQEWQTTLLPYRNYFRFKYGGVKYQRETTPIRGTSLADVAFLSPDNPFGFQPHLRPDTNGWAPVRAMIMGELAGWPTVVMWAPSGFYYNNSARDYPYLFTSHWDATPRLAEVYNGIDGLPSLVAAGRRFGLWWGNSAEVSFTWDSPTWENFDPDNPSHVTAAFREMDGAARSGATVIGLDTFMHDLCPIWKAYGWVQTLQSRYPQMKFCTETSSCDIMHTIAPTFVPGWQWYPVRPGPNDPILIISHPNYLADLINPGHETWGQLSHQEQKRWFGTLPSTAEMTSDMNSFAANGYRVIVVDAIPAPPAGTALAVRSWESSLPASIRDGDPYIADIRAGRLPGQAAPSPVGGGGGAPGGGGAAPGGGGAAPGGGGGSRPPIVLRAPRQSNQTTTTSTMVWHRRNTRISPIKRQGIISHYVVPPADNQQQPQ
jgi:hypothetical protein